MGIGGKRKVSKRNYDQFLLCRFVVDAKFSARVQDLGAARRHYLRSGTIVNSNMN